ncbi:MAG TPA: hypothetical protein VLE19_06575, partial [Pyrinomonadaceae bacterium]|nr:hypothetical protein [Pyrinomonadaceae bacterium]
GPVKSVRVETAEFEERDGQIVEKPWMSDSTTFNQDGWIIEQVNRNPDGSEWRTVNEYSDAGTLQATRAYDASGLPSSEVRYIYDDELRLVSEQHHNPDGTITTPTRYAYDQGRKVKIEDFDFSQESNVLIGVEGTNTCISAADAKRVETRYDDQGEAVAVTVFDSDGMVVNRIEIVRDALGNPLEEIQYVGDVFPLSACASGSCSTEEVAGLTEEQKAEIAKKIAQLFSRGTPMSKHAHRYDTKGRLVESKLTTMGMEASHQTYTYDDAGNKLEEMSHNQNGTVQNKAIFRRDFDEHGNWIKELVSTASSSDGEFGVSTPAHVTRRTITYE